MFPPVSQINQSVMEAALSPDMLATDLAYYLVRKGVSSVHFHPNANREEQMCEAGALISAH